jgi:hypothetical protein
MKHLKKFTEGLEDHFEDETQERLKPKVKHLIEYLSKLDPEMEVHLDKDGWQGYGDTEVELIETSGLFEPFGDSLFINN